jgi:hypothetical protein
MAKRKCPQERQQDGVCGCPSFWRRSKPAPKPNVKKSSPITTVIDSDLHHRERQKREGSVSQAGEMDLSRSKSLAYTESKLMARNPAGQKQNTVQVEAQAQQGGWAKKKKAKANRPVRILVDYDLPSGAERLDWDTDEVRRMVDEIA